MPELKTTIGLEIHVQLKTKSKMFCRCDNDAQGKMPNSVVCPVCLGLPGALPVANEQAILFTIKTGLALGCNIGKIAKFDRKHYFYPDLPKGYQISQYDEPFCIGGEVTLKNVIPAKAGIQTSGMDPRVKPEDDNITIRLNRIHLEEDAGKLIHTGNKSLVDLNRAGTPLMEIVSEPDITSPEMAGDFLRKLQKIVRDQVQVSEADMEKGHLRCDANISLCEMQDTITNNQSPKMSEIVELKNLNSFKFVEKALTIEEARLKNEYPNWPEKLKKVTRGYDSVKNTTYEQRTKEEASDYRYFPEPDLPPIDTTKFDIESLRSEINHSEQEIIEELVSAGIAEADAKVLVADNLKFEFYQKIAASLKNNYSEIAKVIVHKYFPFDIEVSDLNYSNDYGKAVADLAGGKLTKNTFAEASQQIHSGEKYDKIINKILAEGLDEDDILEIISSIIEKNPAEVEHYRLGKTQLFGFFMGLAMREAKGKADPKLLTTLLKEKLEG